ncbi:protein Frey 1 isoform X1 [Falco cherrug]|uniref:protein Frey 1 isoform X1 n=2 Tax=Falco cherrug TaxID=345164 RepID=UPI00247A5F33|nr:protein Frey 1 isoform X1 [Falco cherrug]
MGSPHIWLPADTPNGPPQLGTTGLRQCVGSVLPPQPAAMTCSAKGKAVSGGLCSPRLGFEQRKMLKTAKCLAGLLLGTGRASYSIPEDFSAPLELPQEHFGLVDDYGIKPKQPRLRTHVAQKQPAGLRRAGKSKRDELDLLEYYDDAHL